MDYDRNFAPVGADTILMEGARMVDEWPILERKIRSEEMVFVKTSGAAGLDVPVESIVEADIDIESVFAAAEDAEPVAENDDDEIRLSREEHEILRMVDGREPVRDIVDRSALSEFDTYRILHELLTRNLIEEAEVEIEDDQAAPPKRRIGVLWTVLSVVVLALAMVSAALFASNRFGPFETAARGGALERLRTFASRDRVQRVERALHLCFLDTGRFPATLDVLVDNSYLDPEDIQDPWGRQYGYVLGNDRYTLIALNPQGQPEEGLTVVRPFSSAMMLILDGGTPDP